MFCEPPGATVPQLQKSEFVEGNDGNGLPPLQRGDGEEKGGSGGILFRGPDSSSSSGWGIRGPADGIMTQSDWELGSVGTLLSWEVGHRRKRDRLNVTIKPLAKGVNKSPETGFTHICKRERRLFHEVRSTS